MNKAQLIRKVAVDCSITKVFSEKLLDNVLFHITSQIFLGNSVKLKSFGSFVAREHRAKVGRNPHTGDPVITPKRLRVRFRASNLLLDTLNNK